MSESEVRYRDRAIEARLVQDARICSVLRDLVTDELIEEHRCLPVGHHSPALVEVLTYFRQAQTTGKLVGFQSPSTHAWQIVRLSGVPGMPHDTTDPERFSTEHDVLHAIFLRRLTEAGLIGNKADRGALHS